MSYYYLATDYEIKEKSFGIETLTITEAINKGYKMPNFFNKKNYSKEELNEPDGMFLFDERGSIEIVSINEEDDYVLDIVGKKFVYEVTINLATDYVFSILYEYIVSQFKRDEPIEFWQLLNPHPKFLVGESVKKERLSKDNLKKIYLTDNENYRLVIE